MELRGVPEDAWDRLCELGVEKKISAGNILFLQNDPVGPLIILKQGLVRLHKIQNDGIQYTFSLCSGYSFLCAAAHVCNKEQYPISATAYTDTAVVYIDWHTAYPVIRNCHSLSYCLLKCISGELLTTYNQTADKSLSVVQRVARFLLLQDQYGMLCFHDYSYEYEIDITHEMLATMIGASRAPVSLALNELERNGIIVKKYGRIRIVSKERLHSYIDA